MKFIGTYRIAGLYFLLGLGLSCYAPRFGERFIIEYGTQWRPASGLMIAPFFWPAYVWALCLGVCALLLCLTTRLPPKTRRRVNIGAWIVFVVLALHAIDWLYGFSFCHEWGCAHMLPTWKLLR